ncbi:MAG: ATP-binding protein [Oscillospiraceae bacterium]|nr:ATP-binding protein [Oscillospiraceae bacterium]
MKNPFNPAFGLRPKQFIGRDDITDEFFRSLVNSDNPWRTTLIVGVRGSGKTSILSDIQLRLKETNAIVVTTSPDEDFLNRILGQIYTQLPKSVINKLPKIKNISVSLSVSVGFENSTDNLPFTNTFDYQITQMLQSLKKGKTHVVFLIDESQKHTAEIRTFISTYQQLIMKEFPISLVMAGLPEVISDVLNDDVLTFLRRANRVDLENIDLNLVKADYRNVFRRSGFNACEHLVNDAAEATQGFPYLIQLIGYYLWENLEHQFDGDVLEQSLIESKSRLFKNIHQLVFDSLSNMDRDFIFSMAKDAGHSKIQNILNRLDKNKNYITQYRSRLISKGVIKPSGHGLIAFTFPYMREFLELKRAEIGLW